MTHGGTALGADERPDGLAQRARRLLPLLVVVLVLALAVVGWLLWTARAEAAAESVRVVAVAKPACAPGREANTGRRVVVAPRAGRPCVVDVTVTNYSERTVRLEGIDVWLGPLGESPYTVAADDTGPRPLVRDDPGGSASTYVHDVELAPGDVYDTQVVLVANPDHCNGGGLELFPWPTARVGVGGRDFSVSAGTNLFLARVAGRPERGPGC
jgi:hypothetical protein